MLERTLALLTTSIPSLNAPANINRHPAAHAESSAVAAQALCSPLSLRAVNKVVKKLGFRLFLERSMVSRTCCRGENYWKG